MPYKSDAQRRWAHTEKGTEALGGPSAVHEWDTASKGKKLPEKVRPASHGFGHSVIQRSGKHRLSGHKGAHRIGKRG